MRGYSELPSPVIALSGLPHIAGPRGRGFYPREPVQERRDGGFDPLADIVVRRSITHHGVMEQIKADHIVEQRGRLMWIAELQTPRSLLLFDEPGNDAPRRLRTALEPGASECRKARRFCDYKTVKRQVLLPKQDVEERQGQ